MQLTRPTLPSGPNDGTGLVALDPLQDVDAAATATTMVLGAIAMAGNTSRKRHGRHMPCRRFHVHTVPRARKVVA